MAEGCIISLVPNEEYEAATDDAHCTLAFFGKAEDIQPWEREIMLNVAEQISKIDAFYKRPPRVTGRGVFSVDPQYNDGNTLCYVDLIDWNVFPLAREMVERKLGMSINRGHGLIPHMTIAFHNSWIPDLARPSGIQVFGWDSVQVWIGDERVRYPIE